MNWKCFFMALGVVAGLIAALVVLLAGLWWLEQHTFRGLVPLVTMGGAALAIAIQAGLSGCGGDE